MNKKMKAICLCAALVVSGALMSFTSSDPTSQFPVPKPLEEGLIGMAVDYKAISEWEGQFLTENHAIQQCVDAFVSSGYEPSAAIDKLAEISVEKGCFKSKAAAKKAMRDTIERERKNEASWTKLYSALGL